MFRHLVCRQSGSIWTAPPYAARHMSNQTHPVDRPPTRGFGALLLTMSCGAINDNLLRGALLLSVAPGGLWGDDLGEGGTGWVTVMLYLPFILLLGVTGQIADKYKKRSVIVWTRLVEISLAVGITVALWQESLLLTSIFFVLLAAQSAFFSPAKYGSVPDLVADDALSRANGILSMLTNMAILLGIAVAGYLLEAGPVLIGLVMIVIAIISYFSSVRIPSLPPAEPNLKVSWRTFTAHFRVLGRMRGSPLFQATLAWSWFYAVGSLVLIIVPMWKAELHLSDSQASLMLAATIVGIGVGGVLAGFSSGTQIRAIFIPIGAAGMTVSFVLLGLVEPTLASALILLSLVGVFAGFYVIPIMAMLQHLPVPTFRARTIGTANFITYVAMTISAVAFGVLAPIFGSEPRMWFLGCAVAMGLVFIGSILQHASMCAGAAASAFATVGESA